MTGVAGVIGQNGRSWLKTIWKPIGSQIITKSSAKLRRWSLFVALLIGPPTLRVSWWLPSICREHILIHVSLDGALQLTATHRAAPVQSSMVACGTLSQSFSRSHFLLSFVVHRPSMCTAQEPFRTLRNFCGPAGRPRHCPPFKQQSC